MSSTGETQKMLKYYTKKTAAAEIDFVHFVAFAKKYISKFEDKNDALKIFKESPSAVLASDLEILASEGRCVLEFEEGKISSINFPEYFREVIEEEYKKIRDRPEVPFPDQSNIGVTIPGELVTPVDVKNDFTKWLGYEQLSKPVIIRLDFPEGIRDVVMTSAILLNDLLSLALAKLKRYITNKKNVNYVINKLLAVFGQKQPVIKEMIDDLIMQHSKSIDTIQNPSDFSFRFWTTLANLIIQEYKPKTNKLPDEHSFCQAAYLIGYYNSYFKGIVQKQKSVQQAFKKLDHRLKSAPYVFTLADIASFKDEKGVPLLKKYNRNQLHSYLDKKTKPKENDTLPEIIRARSLDKHDYYIFRDRVLPLILSKVGNVSSALRKEYIDEWINTLRQFKKTNVMFNDDAFYDDVVKRVKSKEPLILTLLRFDLLYLAGEDSAVTDRVREEISTYFDTTKNDLRPLTRILGLDREELLNNAKTHLPFWQTIPVLSSIVILFKRMFMGNKAKRKRFSKGSAMTGHPVSKVLQNEKSFPPGGVRSPNNGTAKGASGKTTEKAQLVEYRKQIAELTEEFVEEGKTIDGCLQELMERWNPLFDPKARNNLIEDVNAMIRDFLRGLRKGFRVKPPDAARIRSMADRLSQNKAFNQIKRKDYFKRYIEIYMLKLLNKK